MTKGDEQQHTGVAVRLRQWLIFPGFLCALSGGLFSYVFYALSKDASFWNPSLAQGMLIAVLIAVGAFVLCRVGLKSPGAQFVGGAVVSYASFLILLLAVAGCGGALAETVAWLPVIVLVGVPYMAPVVVMAWLGVSLALPEEAAGSDPGEASNGNGGEGGHFPP